MRAEIERFENYLVNVKKSSDNTVASYRRDLIKLSKYMNDQGMQRAIDINCTGLNSYVLYLEKQGMSSATVSRSIASIKAFFAIFSLSSLG